MLIRTVPAVCCVCDRGGRRVHERQLIRNGDQRHVPPHYAARIPTSTRHPSNVGIASEKLANIKATLIRCLVPILRCGRGGCEKSFFCHVVKLIRFIRRVCHGWVLNRGPTLFFIRNSWTILQSGSYVRVCVGGGGGCVNMVNVRY